MQDTNTAPYEDFPDSTALEILNLLKACTRQDETDCFPEDGVITFYFKDGSSLDCHLYQDENNCNRLQFTFGSSPFAHEQKLICK